MRTIKNIHRAIDAPIDNLITYRAMPTTSINHIDPFIFLNHHGPQDYLPNNQGLPFGPHPHRGFETLTFIFEGNLMHWDSGSGKSIINAGGVQWMTAGRGIVHAEISSDEFKKKGGRVELIQLWFNLPAKHKMIEPKYTGLQKDQVPAIQLDNGKAEAHLVSGKLDGIEGPVRSITDITFLDLKMRKGSTYNAFLNIEHRVLFYIVKGKVEVNEKKAEMHQLVEFGNDHERITIKALEDSLILFGHAAPLNEPIVARGPFVMNNEAEIKQAYLDYQSGKMGSWEM